MNTSVFALQSIRRMRGGSQSQLMRCSDGEYYVVKFQNNPQGVRTLANELLGTLLASQLGLPVPEIAVISVDGKLIKHTYDMAIEQQRGRTPCKAGRCIGSRYPRIEGSGADSLATVYGWLPLHLFPCVDNLAEFLGMLVFDSWVGNTDARQVIFVRDETRAATWPHCSYHALMIDEGFCFNACNWNFLPNRSHCLYDQAIVYEHVSGMNVFEKWLDRLEGQINRDTLDRAAEEIPLEWNDGARGSLAKLLAALDERRHQVRALLLSARKARPRSFPAWNCSSVNPNQAHAAPFRTRPRISKRRSANNCGY